MNTEKDTIKASLLDFLSASFMVDVDEIPVDRSLVDEGIIDSFGLVEIAAYFERTYTFSVEETDMTRDNFGSVEKMVEYVDRNVRCDK